MWQGRCLDDIWRHSASWPCRIHAILGWFRSLHGTEPTCYCAGCWASTFGSIFVELWFIFTSFWNYKFYYVCECPCLIFVIAQVASVKDNVASALVLVLLSIKATRLTFTHTHTNTLMHLRTLKHNCIIFKDSFMLLVYLMLSIVTICVTIVAICKFCFSSSAKRLLHCIRNSLRICWPKRLPDFHLNSEDYRWWWLSFLSGGSSSVYVFLYAVYYFFAKTHMHGFLQISFYFGYTALFCFGLFLVGGTIGHMGSRWFVTRI